MLGLSRLVLVHLQVHYIYIKGNIFEIFIFYVF